MEVTSGISVWYWHSDVNLDRIADFDVALWRSHGRADLRRKNGGSKVTTYDWLAKIQPNIRSCGDLRSLESMYAHGP